MPVTVGARLARMLSAPIARNPRTSDGPANTLNLNGCGGTKVLPTFKTIRRSCVVDAVPSSSCTDKKIPDCASPAFAAAISESHPALSCSCPRLLLLARPASAATTKSTFTISAPHGRSPAPLPDDSRGLHVVELRPPALQVRVALRRDRILLRPGRRGRRPAPRRRIAVTAV